MRRLPAVAAAVALGLGLAGPWESAGSPLTAKASMAPAAAAAVRVLGRERVPRFGTSSC
jgi:hypothetical protein